MIELNTSETNQVSGGSFKCAMLQTLETTKLNLNIGKQFFEHIFENPSDIIIAIIAASVAITLTNLQAIPTIISNLVSGEKDSLFLNEAGFGHSTVEEGYCNS